MSDNFSLKNPQQTRNTLSEQIKSRKRTTINESNQRR